MNEENKSQNTTAESNVKAAAKTGKAVANIAKGAATGGMHGAALETAKSAKNWIIPIIAALLLPLILLAMLPSVIFGSFFGDGTDTTNAIVDDRVLVQNMVELNNSISTILSEGLADVLTRIESNFASSGCDDMEINNPYGSDVIFNANYFISMYCASKNTEIASISLSDMEAILRANQSELYSYTYSDETRYIEGETDPKTGTAKQVAVTVRVYEVQYNGEAYFQDKIFKLTDDQKLLASSYALNLSVLLGDGMYQALSATEFSGMGASYEGVIFTDGVTQVVYYNQLDERWANAPYGTDHVGGYGCGPTAMSIIISSLTSDTVDPAHMAQWSYENGYWCSKSGSYHNLIPKAAEAWSLNVEGCTASEPQRIVDALSHGKLVVALMTKGHFTSSGHFIVLRGVTADGKILVADPASYSRSERAWDLSLILKEASKNAWADGPFWIIGN